MKQTFDDMMRKATAAGLHGKGYPKTGLINCKDSDGTIQSYYTTTGTAIFRAFPIRPEMLRDTFPPQRKTIPGASSKDIPEVPAHGA